MLYSVCQCVLLCVSSAHFTVHCEYKVLYRIHLNFNLHENKIFISVSLPPTP